MVQVMPAKMAAVQKALRDMRDVEIVCGPVDGVAGQTEVVSLRWVENDLEFNVGYVGCWFFFVEDDGIYILCIFV